MDDDGLILNFAMPDTASETPAVQKPVTYSGGRWKERRNMKLKSQGREWKQASGPNGIDMKAGTMRNLQAQAEDMMKDAAAPKKKNDPKSAPVSARPVPAKRPEPEQLGISSKRVKFSETSGEKGGKNSSYVSSLFTSKNAASLKETAPATTSHKPSNAPLTDSSTFEGLGLHEKLASHLTSAMKYSAPTEVQRAVAPRLLGGETDLFVKAQTGSGKTLAFALPILDKLLRESAEISRSSGLFALILTPTRELAQQIYAVLESVLRCHHQIVPGIVVGGEKKKSEKARFRKGVNVLVATPGRLADHLENTESLDVSQVRWLVLDEGDRLVELGFQETISTITDVLSRRSKVMDSMHKWPGLPARRVNVLCSATMPDDVKQLGSTVLTKPHMISVDGHSAISGATAPDQLVQKVVVVPPKLRLVTLAAALKAPGVPGDDGVRRTMVFFSCSDSVNFHYEAFTRGGIATMRKSSSEREKEREKEREERQREKEREKEREQEELLKDNKKGKKGKPTRDREHKEHKGKKESDESAEAVPQFCACTAPCIDSNTVVLRLHGSLTQQQRTATLHEFVSDEAKNKGKHLVLFCTDVASRGLDFPNIAHVVEYDPPFTVDDHLHRIGRSARAGNQGSATLFLLPGEEEGYVEGKIRVMHPKKGSVRVVNYESLLEKTFAEGAEDSKGKNPARPDPKSKHGKWDIHATTWHLDVERWLLEDKAALEKASNAFVSHIRAYATHLGSERMYFNVKSLHLGHLAKAFGLRDTPKKLGRASGTSTSEAAKKKEDPRKKMLRMARMTEKARSSEFNY